MYNRNVYKFDDMKRKEHMGVRTSAGWYLWTHQLLEVTGKDAAAFLDLIYANPIASLKVGRERYTTMLDEAGEILDDVVVFRLKEEKFWVSTLFITPLMKWLEAHKGEYHVQWVNVTPRWHMYAVQGPKSKDLMNELVDESIEELKFFSFCENKIDNIPVLINRAGFTGEKWGYEIYISPEHCDFLEDKLREVGKPFQAVEVTEFQVMAWTLPTEKGFYYMRDLRHTNPLEAGLDKGINWDKEFIGKEALLEIKKKGVTREFVGFTVEQDDIYIHARDLGGDGAAVMVNGEMVGEVSKLNYSYVLDKNIGYILAQKARLKPGDHVRIKEYEAIISEKVFI